jgi:hypothetical protein
LDGVSPVTSGKRDVLVAAIEGPRHASNVVALVLGGSYAHVVAQEASISTLEFTIEKRRRSATLIEALGDPNEGSATGGLRGIWGAVVVAAELMSVVARAGRRPGDYPEGGCDTNVTVIPVTLSAGSPFRRSCRYLH